MFELLENILHELKNVPGLAFLKRLHTQLSVKQSRLRTKMQVLKNNRDHMKQLAKRAGEISQSAKGSKGRKA